MSVYSTRTISREEAIKELKEVRLDYESMTNVELEDVMFSLIGREDLPNSPLNNYIVTY